MSFIIFRSALAMEDSAFEDAEAPAEEAGLAGVAALPWVVDWACADAAPNNNTRVLMQDMRFSIWALVMEIFLSLVGGEFRLYHPFHANPMPRTSHASRSTASLLSTTLLVSRKKIFYFVFSCRIF
ncbi:MAG: hypothetical protein ACO1N5_03580 [Noviherbaspirillum sp.]